MRGFAPLLSTTLFKAAHDWKADPAILVTLPGIITDGKPLPRNACDPIVRSDGGSDTEVNAGKLINAFPAIAVQELTASNVTLVNPLALVKALLVTELQLEGIASVVNKGVLEKAVVLIDGHCPPFANVRELRELH